MTSVYRKLDKDSLEMKDDFLYFDRTNNKRKDLSQTCVPFS